MAVEGPPAKKRKIDFKDQFEVVVSDSKTTQSYTVPKSVLVKSSCFLRAACNKEWKEGQTKKIELSDTNPEHFGIYLQFLYEGQIVPTNEKLEDLKPDSETSKTHWWSVYSALVNTYLLADMLMDIPAKNASVDCLISLFKISGKITWLKEMYEKTMENSPLRRLAVDMVCPLDRKGVKNAFDLMPTQFAVDVALRLQGAARERKMPVHYSLMPKCSYHEHDDEHPRCRSSRMVRALSPISDCSSFESIG